MNDLLDLADRCERAEGPDRELDAKVALAIGWQNCIPCGFNGIKARMGGILNAPAYTASIDAAMTLVPEGWDGGLYLASPGLRPNVQLETEQMRSAGTLDRFQPIEGSGATLALALCAAALRARAA